MKCNRHFHALGELGKLEDALQASDLDASEIFSYAPRPMNRSLLVAACLTATVARVVPLCGADLDITPRQGVLLLNNGELIKGTVTAAGDHYDVHLEDGQIRIRTSQVAVLARNARECYRHLQSEIQFGRVQDYLELAEWCLRNKLLAEAEHEIAAAKRTDATHPKIPLVETRLRLARQASEAASLPKPDIPDGSKPKSAAQSSEPPQAEEPLDRVVRDLHPAAIENFTNHVQPLLLNYCARSGCHTHPSRAMRLERISPNRHTGRKTTQRNLSAVLTMVDRNRPADSKLLKVPVSPHGGRDQPVFTGRQQSQYRQLVTWVYQVSRAPSPVPQSVGRERSTGTTENAADSTVQPAAATAPSLPEDQTGTQRAADAAAEPNRLPTTMPADAASRLPSAPPAGQGTPGASPSAEKAAYRPKDPFDPEIFNRRHTSP